MPLLTELSDWRGQLDRIERTIYNSSADMDVVFIADFPGEYLKKGDPLCLKNITYLPVITAKCESVVGDKETWKK